MKHFIYLFFMNFKQSSFLYHDKIILKYFYEPHKNISSDDFKKLYADLLKINQDSGKNFSYGIFDNNYLFFFEKIFLCTMYDKDTLEPIGFFYFSILNKDQNLIHSGLTIISKNPGLDLLSTPQMLGHLILFKNLQTFCVSTITCIPKVVGEFCEYFEQVWPSPNSDQDRPDKQYINYLDILKKEYINRYIVNSENEDKISVDSKRFILRSPSKNMGFIPNYYTLPKHQKVNVNLFCLSWIDYNNEEDIILFGKCSKMVILKFMEKLSNKINNLDNLDLSID